MKREVCFKGYGHSTQMVLCVLSLGLFLELGIGVLYGKFSRTRSLQRTENKVSMVDDQEDRNQLEQCSLWICLRADIEQWSLWLCLRAGSRSMQSLDMFEGWL